MGEEGRVYVIRDWDKHFESAESRKVSSLSWVKIPLKHDGLGFRKLISRRDGCKKFGVFVLILECAAKMPVRGRLEMDGIALTAEDIAKKTGAPKSEIQSTLELLSSSEYRWISVESQGRASSKPGADQVPSRDMSKVEESRVEENRGEKRGARGEGDGKQRKQNGTDVVLLAIAEACGLDLKMIDERTALEVTRFRSTLEENYGDDPLELAQLIRDGGRWHYEIDFPGHRPSLKTFRQKWGAYREWKLNLKPKETEDERIARLIEETERRYPSKAH